MSKSFGDLIAKIFSGEKTIESRWSRHKISPYGKINPGDMVYFKYSGHPVTTKAMVSRVLQFDHLNLAKIKEIIDKYSGPGKICLQETEDLSWYLSKNYCTLIFLKDSTKVTPFQIDKTGFGSGCAWLSIENIKAIKLLRS